MKRLIGGVVAVTLSLTYATIPSLMPVARSQTRRDGQELLQKLLQQAVKQTEAGQLQQSLNTLQKALVLARRLKDTKTESEILAAIELTKTVLAAGVSSTPTPPPSRTATTPAPQTSALIEQGLEQTKLGEPNKAIATFNRAITLARQNQDKGLFTKELEVGMLQQEIDFAVHSLKDLPTNLPDSLVLGVVTERENPADAVVFHEKYRDAQIENLPPGAVVGTSSLRRLAQLRHQANYCFHY